MEFIKKVQFLGHIVNDNNLHCYDFLDLESNLPFTVYTTSISPTYDKLEPYKVLDCKFNLVRVNSKTGLAWKIKAV